MAYNTKTTLTETNKGVVRIVFCDPASPGQLYECAAASTDAADVSAAILALCDQRKAAGVYYPSEV